MLDHCATVLLTLGRLPVALEIARAFACQGYRVVVAEPYKWPLCRLSNSVDKCFKTTPPNVDQQSYLDELLSIVSAENVDLIVPVSEESLFVTDLHSLLPDSVTLACMDSACLLNLHDKWRFARWARQHGLAVPHSVRADDEQTLDRLLTSDYVVKPRLSCSGVGVRFGRPGQALLTEEKTSRNLVQRRLTDKACSTFSIVIAGRVHTTICYQGLLQSGSVSVCFEKMEIPDEIAEFVQKAVGLLQYTGMISFDFMQNVAGRWLAIECNPRATSGIHFVSTDCLIEALLAVANEHAGQRRFAVENPVECATTLPVGTIGARRQEFWSCLGRVEGDLFKGRWNGPGWRRLFTTPDITWSRRDMKPFLLMPVVLAPQLWQAVSNRQPISELLMLDVGWYQEISTDA